ncbi:MAG: hypothetical protein C5B59_12030 [Bacteroidetes bacterium]|nr:MAG: hypothetical protein C5B59_12030 [Bacteroidota bacterium]
MSFEALSVAEREERKRRWQALSEIRYWQTLRIPLQFNNGPNVLQSFPLQRSIFKNNIKPMSSSQNGHTNGVYSYDLFSGNKKKRNSHFLWWCAGVHQDLLKEYPTDHSRYAGLGAVILATFVLASISAGYAVYMVFGNPGWAIAFGMIWGMIIFNFDRFLVSTMRKYGVSMGKQISMAVPRIVLALLIGITIARPLELKLFEKEIDTKVAENRHQKVLANDSLLQAEHKAQIASAVLERNRLTERKTAIEDSLHTLQKAYLAEADGTGGTMMPGVDRITRLKQNAFNNAFAQYAPELEHLTSQIKEQDSILNTSKADMDARQKNFQAKIAASTGFLERNKALSDLSSEEPSVFWASLLISLLIIIIETAPVLSKMIMNAGPYELGLAKTELIQMADAENEMRRDKQMKYDRLDALYQKKREVADEVMNKVAELQKKQIDRDLDQWERGESSNIQRQPMDEILKKFKERYDVSEENIL